MSTGGKSHAQDELADKIGYAFPNATVKQEVPIGTVIATHGFSPDEIARELGHKPHRMSVDIMMTSSECECAFEYQGEQHYSAKGNMNASSSALLWDQALDEEKAWILNRIGVPIVQVPFDEYVDTSVIMHDIDAALDTLHDNESELVACSGCGRLFPYDKLDGDGMCNKCVLEGRGIDATLGYDRYGIPVGMYSEADDGEPSLYDMSPDERKKAKRERDRDRRREARERYKSSPEYREAKEQAKVLRRQRYQEMKQRNKAERGR